jgi:hypothetical protein
MSTQPSALSLEGLQRSGMTPAELRIKHYAVGGEAAGLEVDAYVLGLLGPDDYQHNLIAQALDEYFRDRHADHPVRYRDLAPRRRREAAGIAGLSYWPGPGEPISSPVSTR